MVQIKLSYLKMFSIISSQIIKSVCLLFIAHNNILLMAYDVSFLLITLIMLIIITKHCAILILHKNINGIFLMEVRVSDPHTLKLGLFTFLNS